MAGHSKFKNIQFRKGAQDKKRSKLFSKLGREITAAAKMGLPDPAMNPRLRTAVAAARARERRPDALSARDALELATLGGAQALGLDGELGSLVPGKQADLTVLSFEGTPYVPWEDPVTAVVHGGSPERVAATLVSGTTRYEKGGKAWLELIDDARRARGKLLSPDARTS